MKQVPDYYYPIIRETTSRNIQSTALDINKFPIKTMIKLTGRLNLYKKQNLIKSFGWIQFSSRTVCLRKKGKEQDKVTNLRPIQISPWNFKIAEQSRTKLKLWIDQNTDDRCFAFKKKKKIEDLISWLKGYINQ